jgi:hypothetical protein
MKRDVRHAARRRCSQVQAQLRYFASEKGKKANAASVAAFRARKKDADAASRLPTQPAGRSQSLPVD